MMVSSGEARPIARSESATANCRSAQEEPNFGGAQAAGRPLPDRDDMDFKYGCGLSLGLISPSPPHGQDTRGCHHNARMTGGRRLTATHPPRRSFGTARRIRWETGSHLGSTLRSGGAVLTRGVSRRSGSVACIRADASPTEVLAGPSSHHYQCSSNMVETKSRGRVARLDGMATTLQNPRVAETLDRMYNESREQMSLLRERRPNMSAARTVQERADAMSEFYIPVTPESGQLLYSLVRATRPATVVEFGMSFGISALHLASAVRDNGTGRVVTTEISDTKITAAKKTFAETGLDDLIIVLEGDALSTLADLAGPVDFVLLDGWKELYLPVIKLLEPKLSPGALVIADNTESADARSYLDYVQNSENGYVSFNFAVRESDSMELSCHAG